MLQPLLQQQLLLQLLRQLLLQPLRQLLLQHHIIQHALIQVFIGAGLTLNVVFTIKNIIFLHNSSELNEKIKT